MEWDDITNSLESHDSKRKCEALSELQVYVAQHGLSRPQTGEVFGLLCRALEDNNTKVSQAGLQVVLQFVEPGGKVDLRSFAPALMASVVEKLGDGKQGIRQDACAILIRLAYTCGHTFFLDRVLESGWWSHKNWRIRQGVASVAAEVVSKLDVRDMKDSARYKLLMGPCVELLEDPNSSVRDAAMDCLQEVCSAFGNVAVEDLAKFTVRPATMRELMSRCEKYCDRKTSMPAAPGSQPRQNQKKATKPNANSSKQAASSAAGLPPAGPIPLESDRELKEVLGKISTQLGLSVDWDKRITALIRLEGIFLGGASSFESCQEYIKMLKDPLTAQINDRRSAVSRQACHAVATMAAIMGCQFEAEAIFFLPVLFKVLIITVQVMADAADKCVHSILRYCQCGRLVPKICEVLISDRNAKSRQHCSKFLLQVMEEWAPSVYERQTDAIENAIRCASQDTTSETRTVGRLAFGAYTQACPERAKSFLKRLDGGLQQKLLGGMSAYKKGSIPFPTIEVSLENVAAVAKRSAPFHPSNVHTPIRHKKGKRNSVTASRSAEPQRNVNVEPPHMTAPLMTITETSPLEGFQPTPLGRLSGNHDCDEDTTWPLAPGFRENMEVGSVPRRATAVASFGGPQRYGVREENDFEENVVRGGNRGFSLPPEVLENGYGEVSVAEDRSQAMDVLMEDDTTGAEHSARLDAGSRLEEKPMGISRLLGLAAEHKAGDWQMKLELLDGLCDCLESGQWSQTQLRQEADRLVLLLKAKIEDAHFRVVQKALTTLCVAMQRAAPIFEIHLDRIMPLLFHKLVDQKEAIQKAAKHALEECGQYFTADLLLPAMVRSLESIKVPRGLAGVLEYSCVCVGKGTAAGTPTMPSIVRQWVSRVTTFVSDKNSEVRRLAINALQNVYQNMDPSTLILHFAQASPQEQMMLRRVLGPVLSESQLSEMSTPEVPRKPKASIANWDSTKPPHQKHPPADSMHDDDVQREPSSRTANQEANHRSTATAMNGRNSNAVPDSNRTSAQSMHVCQPAAASRNAMGALAERGNKREMEFEGVVEDLLQGSTSLDHLRRLAMFSRERRTDSWRLHFDKVLGHLLKLLDSADSVLREQLLILIQGILVNHGNLLNPQRFPNLMEHALACTKDSSGLVLLAVDQLLGDLIARHPVQPSLDLLTAFLHRNMTLPPPDCSSNASALRCCIQSLSQVFQRMSTEEISKVFPGEILEDFFFAWKSPNVEVRKAVVCCLATVCARLGPRAQSFLGPLSASQAKLLDIYIQKAQAGGLQMGSPC
ncbi:hypothetical protein BSKO_00951 [Bryopsis sp. KO-2023]|nr:hypothetical protein BSKO_00951 [Bryopsis sp. KO-2023]